MSDKPLGSQQPGDSKSTADKLVGDAKSVGQNIADTGSHYADKTGASEAGDKVGSAVQNVGDTAKHYADKAQESTPSATSQEKTYLEQAQDMAASALNTASKAASDLASSISGEKK